MSRMSRIYLVVAVVAFVVVSVVITQYQKELAEERARVEQLEAASQQSTSEWENERKSFIQQVEELNVTIRDREEQLAKLPVLDDINLMELERSGFKGAPEDLVEQIKSRSEWIPYDGILGGTMQFRNVYLLSDRWALGEFDDGHAAGYGLFQFVIDNGNIRLGKVLDAYILGSKPSVDDCSRIDIPDNVERNTSLDYVQNILEVSFYDDKLGRDVTYKIDYTRTDCSKNVNALIKHVLGDPVTGGLDFGKMGYERLAGFVKSEVRLGSNVEQIQWWFGEGDAEYIHPDTGDNQWRLDIGASADYEYKPEVASKVDIEGLQKGKLAAQLYITWDSDMRVKGVSLWYTDGTKNQQGDMQIYVYNLFPDGETSDAMYK